MIRLEIFLWRVVTFFLVAAACISWQEKVSLKQSTKLTFLQKSYPTCGLKAARGASCMVQPVVKSAEWIYEGAIPVLKVTVSGTTEGENMLFTGGFFLEQNGRERIVTQVYGPKADPALRKLTHQALSDKLSDYRPYTFPFLAEVIVTVENNTPMLHSCKKSRSLCR